MAPSSQASDTVLDTTTPYKLVIIWKCKQYTYYQIYLDLHLKQTFTIILGPPLGCTWAHPHPH